MNLANHRTEVTLLIEEWFGNYKQAKNLINCLVGLIADDFNWLKSNISEVDRKLLIEIADKLKQSTN